jgi:hypothetical protein
VCSATTPRLGEFDALELLEEHVEGDLGFQPRKRGANAAMTLAAAAEFATVTCPSAPPRRDRAATGFLPPGW